MVNMDITYRSGSFGRSYSWLVQNTEYGPNYNPYSYCFNNPLKYIDPSGYTTGWFRNGETGQYYFNSELTAEDLPDIQAQWGEEWKYEHDNLGYMLDISLLSFRQEVGLMISPFSADISLKEGVGDGSSPTPTSLDNNTLASTNKANTNNLTYAAALTLATTSTSGGWSVASGEPTYWGEVIMGAITLSYAYYIYLNRTTNYPGPWYTDRPKNYIPDAPIVNSNREYFPQGNGNKWIKWVIRLGGTSVLGKKIYDGFNNYQPPSALRDNTNLITPPFHTPIPDQKLPINE